MSQSTYIDCVSVEVSIFEVTLHTTLKMELFQTLLTSHGVQFEFNIFFISANINMDNITNSLFYNFYFDFFL